MPNPFFSGRIPKELLDHVEAYRESTGASKTDVLVKALAAYTGFELEDKSDIAIASDELAEVFERLEKLENKVFKDEKKSEICDINERQYSLLDQITEVEETKETQTQTQTQILTTTEIVKAKIASQGALSQWKNNGLLPKEYNGYVIDFSHSETSPRNSFWKITPI